jgi:hypothetical protein
VSTILAPCYPTCCIAAIGGWPFLSFGTMIVSMTIHLQCFRIPIWISRCTLNHVIGLKEQMYTSFMSKGVNVGKSGGLLTPCCAVFELVIISFISCAQHHAMQHCQQHSSYTYVGLHSIVHHLNFNKLSPYHGMKLVT